LFLKTHIVYDFSIGILPFQGAKVCFFAKKMEVGCKSFVNRVLGFERKKGKSGNDLAT